MVLEFFIILHADCTYKTTEGKTCLVRSHAKLFQATLYAIAGLVERESIFAKIYVNVNNPKDYAVELFELDKGCARIIA